MVPNAFATLGQESDVGFRQRINSKSICIVQNECVSVDIAGAIILVRPFQSLGYRDFGALSIDASIQCEQPISGWPNSYFSRGSSFLLVVIVVQAYVGRSKFTTNGKPFSSSMEETHLRIGKPPVIMRSDVASFG